MTAEISCAVCSEVVYPEAEVILGHFFERLPGGRWRWHGPEGFGIVHECPLSVSVVEQAEAITRTASGLGVGPMMLRPLP